MSIRYGCGDVHTVVPCSPAWESGYGIAAAPDSATLARVAKNISSVRDSLTTLTQATKTVTDTIVAGNTRDYLFKYGSFMAAMVLSKSSSDVENTIEAFALPAGSSRIKRESVFNVALNGYAGLYYGHEQIPGIKDHLAFNSGVETVEASR